MQKDKRNIFILLIVIMIVISISYLLFFSGLTIKLKASLQNLTVNNNDANASDLPLIDSVINSSGQQLVNTDVAIIINSSSKYNITKIEYSFDLKDWKKVKGEYGSKNVTTKIVFEETMNEKVYIRVENEKGYKSYAYETVVNIDKEKPSISFNKDKNNVVISASDNNIVETIQYSNDKLSWEDEVVSAESVTITKNLAKGSYIRAVDAAGNISEVKKID